MNTKAKPASPPRLRRKFRLSIRRAVPPPLPASALRRTDAGSRRAAAEGPAARLYVAKADSARWGKFARRAGWVALGLVVAAAALPDRVWLFFSHGHSLDAGLLEATGPVELGWIAGFRDAGRRPSRPAAVAFSSDGRKVFVTGASAGRGDRYGLVTIAYDAQSGRSLWLAREPGRRDMHAADNLFVCPGGERIFVTGWAATGDLPTFAVIAYSAADGGHLWMTSIPVESRSGDFGAVLSPDGQRLFVFGTSVLPGSSAGLFLASIDARSGAVLWKRANIEEINTEPLHSQIAMGTGGDTVFAAALMSDHETGWNWLISAYSAESGREQWSTRYRLSDPYRLEKVAVGSQDALLYIAGTAPGRFDEPTGSLVVSLDAQTGEEQWARARGVSQASATDLLLNREGSRLFVSGQKGSGFVGNQQTGLLVAYDTGSGEMHWEREFPALIRVLATAASNEVERIVLAGARASGPRQPVVIASDMTDGAERWVARYARSDTANTAAVAIAISPDGHAVAIAGAGVAHDRISYSTALLRAVPEEDY